MFKICKKKLIITFVTVTVVGGISIRTLPMFHNAHTTIKKSKASNITENYTKDVTVDSKNIKKNDDNKELDSLSDTKNSSNNNESNSSSTNKQKVINSESEKPSNNSVSNNQAATSSQLKSTNSNINTENQNSTNPTLEVKIPTIHYDRTTSIYANDNITLLRIEYYINNQLTYYSVIEQFDATTKSYIEKIYQCDRETNIDPLVRTDVYANGKLIKSY